MKKKAFQADVVFIGNQQFIPNGVVELDEQGIISHVGQNSSSLGIEPLKLEGFLCPGFINTHCHLELSHLKNKVSEGTQLSGFVKELQQLRNAEETEVQKAIRAADQEMKSNGIVAVGDISNGENSFKTKSSSVIFYHSFLELFGFDRNKASEIYDRGLKLKQEAIRSHLSASIVPHSPYSVSNDLMSLIGKTESNQPISIHNQETESENQMFEQGKGNMIEMLKAFGSDLTDFSPSGKASIFNYLPLLNQETNTLLVHNTFTEKIDIEWAESIHPNLFWCFCPNANEYIEKRLPNIPQFIKSGVKCTLGTDSLASNWQLSIWAEIETIQKKYPHIKTEILVEMACLNGAQFLGISDNFGSIALGKKPGLNWVKDKKITPLV